MAATSLAGADLHRQLSKLPQELRDEIFELVFTPDPGVRIIDYSSNPPYNPPVQLQVSRTTRRQCSQAYYSEDTAFLWKPSAEGIYASSIDLTRECSSHLTDLRSWKSSSEKRGLMILRRWHGGRFSRREAGVVTTTVTRILEQRVHSIGLAGTFRVVEDAKEGTVKAYFEREVESSEESE